MKQFYVTEIFAITEATNHFEKNTIFAQGEDGLYFYDVPFNKDVDARLDPKCWPNKSRKGIQLFRDHWKFFCDNSNRNHGTYYLEVMDAPKTVIKKI